MSALADFTSMLGCRIRLTEFVHEGAPCLRLNLDMGPEDGRRAEVLLSCEDWQELERGRRGIGGPP
ncbi:hypothetical protein SEA_SADLAD_59 [Microbacterium phage SadLad]|nr:hypothetical protein SEA_RUBYRALPH_58 [Microbacterium phage RubyRalph]QUE25606.1 hypothetical protein SEA_SADLAD_59 [Microbacterium phage SadLad]